MLASAAVIIISGCVCKEIFIAYTVFCVYLYMYTWNKSVLTGQILQKFGA